jgi:hypothetical protein
MPKSLVYILAALPALYLSCHALADDLALPPGISNSQDPKDVPL